MKIRTIDFRTKEQKRADRWNFLKRGYKSVAGFTRENMDVIAVWVPAGGVALGGICRVASKLLANRKLNKEIAYKQRTIYDRSLGKYTELKRPMTTAQSLAFAQRRANGEQVQVILNDMGLLKR